MVGTVERAKQEHDYHVANFDFLVVGAPCETQNTEACRRTQLTLDVIGAESGSVSTRPQDVLGQYDMVFAKARCALEALAVGSAVVLCDTIRQRLLNLPVAGALFRSLARKF